MMKKCNSYPEFRLKTPTKNILVSNNDTETIFSIFPNPINDIAIIRTNIDHAHIILFDNVSRIIVDDKIIHDSDIDLSTFPNGIYILKIENLKTSEYWIKKLIVQ